MLYFCSTSIGGVARNAIEQAAEISNQGVEVTFLAPTDFPEEHAIPPNIHVVRKLIRSPRSGQHGRLLSRALLAFSILRNQWLLYRCIVKGGHRHVMLATYIEYLAPLYAWIFRMLRKRGVVFGANVLDPVRDHVVGPLRWHRLSVAAGFSYLSEAFVHKMIVLDTVRPMEGLTTTEIPHGPYLFPVSRESRREMRERLGIPEAAYVFLAFGHLRDNKNLMLALEALRSVPEAMLLVAGSEGSPGQTQFSEYEARAREYGIGERVRWLIRYIPDDEVSGIFGMADCLLMPYSVTFRSTSGVLYAAMPHQLPVVVSAGDSPLLDIVRGYGLGHVIEPDSVEAIVAGLRQAMKELPKGQWDRFAAEHSYRAAAEIICGRMFGGAGAKSAGHPENGGGGAGRLSV